MKQVKNKKIRLILVCLLALFFVFYFYICYCSPVTGDDWGYAVRIRANPPIISAIDHYMTWAGRFLSEWYGFAITPHKNVWNVLNPILFTTIIYYLWKLSFDEEERSVFQLLFGLFMMLTVTVRLRTETYNWMMGTTYVIPLALFLVYIDILRSWLFANQISRRQSIAMGLLNFSIPLYMENAAAMLLGVDVLLLGYIYCKDRTKLNTMAKYLIICLISVAILRLSPGSHARLNMSYPSFTQLSIFDKIIKNWKRLMEMTFIRHVVLMRCLSVVSFLLVIQKAYQKRLSIPKGCALLLGILFMVYQSFSNAYADLSISRNLTLVSVGGLLFLLSVFLICIWIVQDKNKKLLSSFVFFSALFANGSMLLSPEFGARSTIYTVYLFILLTLLLVAEFDISINMTKLTIVISFCAVLYQGWQYINMFTIQHYVDEIRHAQMEYYHAHPEEKELSILGFWRDVVHSGNMPASDVYHHEKFKEYYGFPQDVTIDFYHLEEYTYESVHQEGNLKNK